MFSIKLPAKTYRNRKTQDSPLQSSISKSKRNIRSKNRSLQIPISSKTINGNFY
uniref:Uncharacterized protein n=1 Tax=Arundo donax TaxID=35708 RepID=A0A0A9ERC9_ARUDO